MSWTSSVVSSCFVLSPIDASAVGSWTGSDGAAFPSDLRLGPDISCREPKWEPDPDPPPPTSFMVEVPVSINSDWL
jgi:hypothetical protein